MINFGFLKFKNQIYYYEFGGPIKNTIENFGFMVFLNTNNPAFLTQKHIHPSPEIEAFFSSEFGVWVGVGSKSHWIIGQKNRNDA